MKNILTRSKKGAFAIYGAFCGIMANFLIMYSQAYAADSGVDKIDNFIKFAKDWLVKIGGVVALVGGVMFALSWQRDDAEGKSKALMTVMAGFMLVVVAQMSNSIFGV